MLIGTKKYNNIVDDGGWSLSAKGNNSANKSTLEVTEAKFLALTAHVESLQKNTYCGAAIVKNLDKRGSGESKSNQNNRVS